MKNQNSPILFFFFGYCLFLLVGISCVKSVSTGLIRDAYIGSAFSFRINDVIALACPDLEIDEAIELQELVQKHPQLNRIIHRYLCTYADWLDGDGEAFKNVNNEKAFKKLNHDILAETKRRNTRASLAISDEEFLTQLMQEEANVEFILENRVPQNLQNFGKPAIVAIKVYSAVTSLWVQILLLLIMALLISPLFAAYSRRFCRVLGIIFLVQGCFWAVVIPVIIKVADWRLLHFVDRILGRSMFLEVTPFLWRGGMLLGIGSLLCIFQSRFFIKSVKMDKQNQAK